MRPLVRFNVSVIVEQDGRREQGYAGARRPLHAARSSWPATARCELAREAVRQALVNLEAVPAPAGR